MEAMTTTATGRHITLTDFQKALNVGISGDEYLDTMDKLQAQIEQLRSAKCGVRNEN